MIKLLIIADDFTGALDTGIQFVKKGIETQVVIGTQLQSSQLSETAQVLVVDSETRPLNSQKAYDVVAQIVRQAVTLGVEVIYKKTDSALRGNVGSELAAVLDAASGHRIHCLLAFPDVNRVTKKGIHYIDGVKLEDSGFGKDPFDPMTCSYIPDILGKQTDKRIAVVEKEQPLPGQTEMAEILVYDAEENADMKKRAGQLKENGELRLLAGCAGFAAFLPEALGLTGNYRKDIAATESFLVVCGSLNPITRQQLIYAGQQGFYRKTLGPEEKLFPGFYETKEGRMALDALAAQIEKERRVEIDSFDPEGGESTAEFADRKGIDRAAIRFSISQCCGKMVKYLVEKNLDMTILMTGGDTLMGFMKEIGVNQITPVAEVGQGTVLSRLYWKGWVLQVVSKSGGYGEPDVFVKTAKQILKNK